MLGHSYIVTSNQQIEDAVPTNGRYLGIHKTHLVINSNDLS